VTRRRRDLGHGARGIGRQTNGLLSEFQGIADAVRRLA
jgi:hypothetical protein